MWKPTKLCFYAGLKIDTFPTPNSQTRSFPVNFSYLRQTPRYSIRSSPICPNFQMTTFKAQNVFLVLGRGHTMNKLTYEYKKMQKLKTQRPPKLNFWGRCVFGIFIFQNFKNTFDYLTAAYFCRQNLIFIFWPTLLIHWSCETTSLLYVWEGFLPYFMMVQLRNHSEVNFDKL